MTRMLTAALASVALMAAPVSAQEKLPDTPQGRMAAAFLAAVNAPDEMALARFQEANFSAAALKRRPTEERLARNRDLRELGTLTVTQVVSASARAIVLRITASNQPSMTLTMEIGFTGDANPKIDTISLTG